jgi:hypothetical protein
LSSHCIADHPRWEELSHDHPRLGPPPVRPAARTIRKEPVRFRPLLEALEGRLAPATLTVNSTADTASDSDNFWTAR